MSRRDRIYWFSEKVVKRIGGCGHGYSRPVRDWVTALAGHAAVIARCSIQL